MKRKDIQELHLKTIKELKGLIRKTQKKLVNLQTDFGAGKLKDIRQLKFKRQDLARIKTILREKELEQK